MFLKHICDPRYRIIVFQVTGELRKAGEFERQRSNLCAKCLRIGFLVAVQRSADLCQYVRVAGVAQSYFSQSHRVIGILLGVSNAAYSMSPNSVALCSSVWCFALLRSYALSRPPR
jgi:hypothetical protein